MSVRPMRFATQAGAAGSGPEWIDRAKRLEALGYGTLAMPDHMIGGAWAAMPALAVAATVTTKLRVGTLVIDNDFRNPTVFARECATVDVLTNGRFELGIGAGWLDRDYQSTGIPFDRGRVRVARLAEAVTLMKRLFTEEQVTFAGEYYNVEKAECRPKPGQRPRASGRSSSRCSSTAPSPTIGRRPSPRWPRRGRSSPTSCAIAPTAASGRSMRSAITSCACGTRSGSRTS